DSLFELVAYTDSDYAGASLDRKFTTGGCQFLRSRLISWQCKKQIVVATSTTEAEYVAAASYYGQCGRRGVKEKGLNRNRMDTTPVEKEKLNSLEDTTDLESIPSLSTLGTTTAGNKVAYHVVANYVRNTWGKYGLIRSMVSSSTELFSFQFRFMDGLDAMLENDLWFIQNNPLILKKWHPDENLLKEDVITVPVWVKLHGVLVTAFSEDRLSTIATKLWYSSNV
nr:zinc knuckle CX2CX4HX4C [Tanacetum cinerariifolium]